MSKYLISFPASALTATGDELAAIAESSHAVVREAKAAGVWVFGGGIDESVAPVRVSGDGATSHEPYPESTQLNGGFAVLEVPTHDDALAWAARIAIGCGCDQEVRKFGDDPES